MEARPKIDPKRWLKTMQDAHAHAVAQKRCGGFYLVSVSGIMATAKENDDIELAQKCTRTLCQSLERVSKAIGQNSLAFFEELRKDGQAMKEKTLSEDLTKKLGDSVSNFDEYKIVLGSYYMRELQATEDKWIKINVTKAFQADFNSWSTLEKDIMQLKGICQSVCKFVTVVKDLETQEQIHQAVNAKTVLNGDIAKILSGTLKEQFQTEFDNLLGALDVGGNLEACLVKERKKMESSLCKVLGAAEAKSPKGKFDAAAEGLKEYNSGHHFYASMANICRSTNDKNNADLAYTCIAAIEIGSQGFLDIFNAASSVKSNKAMKKELKDYALGDAVSKSQEAWVKILEKESPAVHLRAMCPAAEPDVCDKFVQWVREMHNNLDVVLGYFRQDCVDTVAQLITEANSKMVDDNLEGESFVALVSKAYSKDLFHKYDKLNNALDTLKKIHAKTGVNNLPDTHATGVETCYRLKSQVAKWGMFTIMKNDNAYQKGTKAYGALKAIYDEHLNGESAHLVFKYFSKERQTELMKLFGTKGGKKDLPDANLAKKDSPEATSVVEVAEDEDQPGADQGQAGTDDTQNTAGRKKRRKKA